MPAHTVTANTPIKLSLRRRAAIAAATLALLLASTAAAWVNTQLVGANSLAPLDIQGEGVLMRVAPAWQADDPERPGPTIPALPDAERYVDTTQPGRSLLIDQATDARPSTVVAQLAMNSILAGLVANHGPQEAEPIVVSPTLLLPTGLVATHRFTRTTGSDDDITRHHQVAVIENGTDQRWIVYMIDALPPGEPLTNRRKVENIQVLYNVLGSTRQTTP
ncbi:MAG: hypothetical protein AAF823_07550 [Planctomycetota bacterium]